MNRTSTMPGMRTNPPPATDATSAGQVPIHDENVALHLTRMARERPDQQAVVVRDRPNQANSGAREAKRPFAQRPNLSMPAGWTHRTFAEMENLSNRYANALSAVGIDRGMRTLLMARPGFDFVALVFALFKTGSVPVMIDPGMGLGRLLECIRDVRARALVGIPAAQALRRLRPGAFRSIDRAVTVGRRWGWGAPRLATLAKNASPQFDPIEPAPHEPAAVLFTSGSTGPAKGVVYEHATFNAQIRAIQSCYHIRPGEIDLPTFPLFALFSLAMGMTTVIPDMDPSHPAKADPAGIVNTIRDFGVTSTFGSPALWRRVARYGERHETRLPTLKRILIAGAPVPPDVIEALRGMLPDGADVHTPYGATESLPVSTISGGPR
jgi:acyl-coenzyme A synthetase/AMP-(fatty) acid ligase